MSLIARICRTTLLVGGVAPLLLPGSSRVSAGEQPITGGGLVVTVRSEQGRPDCTFRLVAEDGSTLSELRGRDARFAWPAQPCTLVVASPHHELTVRRLTREGPVSVSLTPARGSVSFRLRAPAGVAVPAIRLSGHVGWKLAGLGAKARPIWVSRNLEVSEGTATISVPSDATLRYMALAEGIMISPLTGQLRPGDPTRELRVLTRSPEEIRLPKAHATLRPRLYVGSIAYNVPPGMDREDLASVVEWYNREDCFEFTPGQGSITVRGLAPVPTHLFVGKLPQLLMHVLVEPPGVRTPAIAEVPAELPSYPVVDGRSVPPGSRVFPGRLDLRTLAMLTRSDADGHVWPPLRGTELSVPIGYTNSPYYTILFPTAEVAYGEWKGADPSHASLARGSLTILRDGMPSQDRVRLVPVMIGSPVEEADTEELLYFEMATHKDGRLSGLPEGDYYVAAVPARTSVAAAETGNLLRESVRVELRGNRSTPVTIDLAEAKR